MNPGVCEQKILDHLSKIPKKILTIHGLENIPEFVLHDLCREGCFNLHKAAYLVDNTDFNYCKGIAGFSRNESYADPDDIWEDPHAFSLYMRSCPFNQRVRTFEIKSPRRNGVEKDVFIHQLVKEFSFHAPDYLMWEMKHNNVGMLIFDRGTDHADHVHEHLKNSVYLFGFCPIF